MSSDELIKDREREWLLVMMFGRRIFSPAGYHSSSHPLGRNMNDPKLVAIKNSKNILLLLLL